MITVAEFKQEISEKVNISADRQRLIFTGKVLTDGNKLKSYNVADKVVHVVNRTPPSTTASSSGASNSTTTRPTVSRPSDGAGNRPSLSMSSVPSNMLGEMMNNVMAGIPSDATVHHIDLRRAGAGPSIHTESGRRVVLIRQWIRDAHSLLDRVRDPVRGTRLTADTQTVEARNASQTVPHMPGESISVSVSTSGGPVAHPAPGTLPSATPVGPSARPTPAQRTTTPSTASTAQPTTRVTPSAGGQTQSSTTPAHVPLLNPHVEVLNSLWGELGALQSRLHPHMHRYQALLNSPASGCPGHNQHLFDTISSVTHSLGHIYHALSDLNCDFGPESNGELTATAAPAPPPTAIIQQTIPVTIPLRATVNVSPRTSRRNRVGTTQTSTTSVTSSTSNSRPPTGQQTQSIPSSTAATSADPDHSGGGQVYTSFELEMETDSGEDISEDGQPQHAAGQAPATPHGPLGGFNISQLLQDAFSGMAGFGGGAPPPPSSATAATFTTPGAAASTAASTPTPAARGVATNVQSGAFGPLISAVGPATTGNGPVLPPGMHLPAGLPLGFPFPPGAQQTPKDRQDPYLSTCSSKHWVPHTAATHEHTHPPSGPRSNPRGTPATNTVNRGVSTGQPMPPRTATNQRQVTEASTRPGATTRAASASSSTSSATNTSSRASTLQPEVLKRRFYDEISTSLVRLVEENTPPRPSAQRSPASSATLHPFSQRLQEICRNASLNRQPLVTISELYRMEQDALPRTTEQEPSLGLLGELCLLLFKDLTVTDLFQAYMGVGQPFDRLRGPLRRFARSNVLQDGPHTNENLGAAVDRLMVSIREQLQAFLSQRAAAFGTCPYDVGGSLCSFIRKWLLDTLNFIITSKEGTDNYGQRLMDCLHQGFRNFLRLAYKLFSGNSEITASGRELAVDIITDVIDYCSRTRRVLGKAFSDFACQHLREQTLVSSVSSIPIQVVRDHLLPRSTPTVTSQTSVPSAGATTTPMHTDVLSSASSDYQDAELDGSLVTNIPTSSLVTPITTPTVSPSPLTTSTLSDASAADWRTVIPADWVAIIEEDIKRQLRLESSPIDQPLSEAYLDGRPSKRRRFSDAEDDE